MVFYANLIKMGQIYKIIISVTIYSLLNGVILYYLILPSIIERRARDLGLMRYDSVSDKFVPKDNLQITGEELYYLQYGILK